MTFCWVAFSQHAVVVSCCLAEPRRYAWSFRSGLVPWTELVVFSLIWTKSKGCISFFSWEGRDLRLGLWVHTDAVNYQLSLPRHSLHRCEPHLQPNQSSRLGYALLFTTRYLRCKAPRLTIVRRQLVGKLWRGNLFFIVVPRTDQTDWKLPYFILGSEKNLADPSHVLMWGHFDSEF